ncbi:MULTISPECIES: hypothetical protein [unclassified Lysinibacillus]|uniref:hypothetical protein n=1 Tax=unclassified Lysinibacillus TaxID=2636778 RepID=UPI0008270D6F|nr:hypothetical protein [Lysinibacillus sp. AR18-8]OCX62697.1 hypothetical protein BFM98_01475 [Lysinibacillus sp. AR18-8]
MARGISFNKYKNSLSSDAYWKPITSEKDKKEFKILLESVESSRKTGTKDQKGKALELLMTYIFNRFVYAEVKDDLRTKDNQLDHEIFFYEFEAPDFIKRIVGCHLINECKNHKKSVSSQEVTILNSNLEIRNCKFGIVSSYKSFSKGRNSVWENAEGKRRKFALLSNFNRLIIGFNYIDFEKILNGGNFYTMMQQKYRNIIDEIHDDEIFDNSQPYNARLIANLNHLKSIGIIPEDECNTYIDVVNKKYGAL